MTHSLPSIARNRVATLGLLLLASAMLPGCTLYVWNEKISWWQVERKSYQRIEAAAIDDRDMLIVRISRDHAEPQTWAIDLQRPNELSVIPNAQFPTAAVQLVDLMSDDELYAARWHRQGSGNVRPGSSFLVGLDGHRTGVHILVADARQPDEVKEIHLPEPPIAWETANAIGHILVTPLTVTLDVALLPFTLVFCAFYGVLYVTGVVHGR